MDEHHIDAGVAIGNLRMPPLVLAMRSAGMQE
jgi:hypothetical protein